MLLQQLGIEDHAKFIPFYFCTRGDCDRLRVGNLLTNDVMFQERPVVVDA